MIFFLALVFIALAVGFAMHAHQRQGEALKRVADAHGLTLEMPKGLKSQWTLRGQRRGRPVELRYWRQSSGKTSHPRYTLRMDGLHPQLKIGKQGLLTDTLGLNADELQVGDATLDAAATLHGPEDVLRGLLGASTRLDLLRHLRRRELAVSEGALVVTEGGHPTDPDEVGQILDAGCDLAEGLRDGPVPPERLLEIARTDPELGVRCRCLLTLLDQPRGDLRAASAQVASTRSPMERAAAALLDGRAEAIAEVPADALRQIAGLDPDRVVRALEAVGAEDALISLLGSASTRVQIPTAQALGAIASVRAVEPLLPLTEGLLTDGALKRVARAAVHDIQRRLGDVSAGSLSLASPGPDAGALSVSAEAGALSQVPRRQTS